MSHFSLSRPEKCETRCRSGSKRNGGFGKATMRISFPANRRSGQASLVHACRRRRLAVICHSLTAWPRAVILPVTSSVEPHHAAFLSLVGEQPPHQLACCSRICAPQHVLRQETTGHRAVPKAPSYTNVLNEGPKTSLHLLPLEPHGTYPHAGSRDPQIVRYLPHPCNILAAAKALDAISSHSRR